jgi:tungstate transport system substrate-binding protein
VLALGRRGDADVLLTHAPADEEEFVRAGYGMDRHRVMHNDFVLLGPPADPAGAASAESAAEALARIRAAGAGFVSRGDDSGTHKKERQLWAALGVTPDWPDYVEAGVGMADAMRLAAQRGAYILADRATYLNLRHELGFGIVHEGDPSLLNQYSVMVISNPRNPAGAGALVEWITGPEARRLIGEYGRARHGGARSFWPDSADLP